MTGLLLVTSTALVALSSAPASAASTAASAATGKVTVTIRAPRGVAANVVLAGPSKALFAKPAVGTSARLTRRLKVGRYRVSPQAVVSHGVLYQSRRHPAVTVAAGRSVHLTVSYASVPSASSLHATDITTTAITLAWSAPRGSTFALRRVIGDKPVASRQAGSAIRVHGLTATDTRLRAGTSYAYALFTRLDRRWVGPITLLAGTAAPKGSKTASFATAAGTLLATPADVRSATGTGNSAQVTLSSGVATPVIGSAVVLPESGGLPGGYVGQVSAVSANGSTVTLRPAALSDAFSYYNVNIPNFTTTPTQLTRATARRANGHPGTAAQADCGGSSSATITFSPSLRLAGSFHATINTTDHLHIPKGASLSMSLTATLTGAMSVQATATLSCELQFLHIFKTITLDPVPISIMLSPAADISINSELDANNLGVSVTAGLAFSGTLGLRSGAHFSGSDILTASPLTPSYTQTGSIGVTVGGQLIVGPGIGDDNAGAIAGLSGQYDPLDATFAPQSAQNPGCIQIDAERSWQLALTATAWIGSWSADRNITLKALTGKRAYPHSPWYFPSGCQNSQPLSVSGGALPAGQVSVAYDQILSASGGTQPYTWTVTGGALPAGLALSSSGELSGTPTTDGSSQFTVQVTDANNNTATGTFTLTINPAVTTPGDITSYTVSADLGCDMSGAADTAGEFYGNTACGTIISSGGELYGPASIPAGGNLTAAANYTPWTPVNQTTTGSGTAGDPYVITTQASAGASPITVSQTDTYVTDGSTVATATTLSNSSGTPVQVMLYHGFDCYPGGSDAGFGTASGGSVTCISDNVTTSGAESLQLAPATGGSTYVEEYYANLWSDIATGNPFSDTVQAGDHDTAAGLAWSVTVPANSSVTVQYGTDLLLTQA